MSQRPRGFASVSDQRRVGTRIPRVLVAVAGALVLLVLILRVSVADAILQAAPGPAIVLSPHHPEARLDLSTLALTLAGSPEPWREAAAREAFERNPLSEVPFLLAARRDMMEGNGESADGLIAVALRRNPRSRLALLLQLERDVRTGRMESLAARMAVLSRLSSDAGALLVPQLARMAAFPSTRDAVREVLAGDSRLRERVLEQLAQSGAEPELVLELAGDEARRPRATVPEWVKKLLDSMVARGQVAQARELWIRQTGISAEAGREPVYDADFAGLPGPAPFNWNLETSADGYAERLRGTPGLQVEYYGRRDARLASQLLLLEPGTYRLSFQAEGQSEGDDTRLAWTVGCLANEQILGEVPIGGVEFTPKTFGGTFTIPAGCSAQWLRLVGRAAEFPKDQQLTMRELRITRSGA